MTRTANLALILALVGPSCLPWRDRADDLASGAEPGIAALRSRIDAAVGRPEFATAHVGIHVESLATGRILYQREADQLFMPASNQKLLTAAAALLSLGPEFTFTTTLGRRGSIQGSLLSGDLVVFGDGDPSLHARMRGDPLAVFRGFADVLRDEGVARITGDIIGDDNAFDDVQLGYGWTLENLPHSYSAEVGPLQLNENQIVLTVHPPPEGTGRAGLSIDLESRYYSIIDSLRVANDGAVAVAIDRPVGSNRIHREGTVVAGGDPVERSPSITNPTAFYVTVLEELLEAEGIAVDGEPRDCDDIPGWRHVPDDFPVLAQISSPPLSELLKPLLKNSLNLYGETLVRALGLHASGVGSFEAGQAEVKQQLEGLGLKPDGYAFADGSGLTRYNWVSPRQIAHVLEQMFRHPELRDLWVDSLPVAGVDGTLRRRMLGTPAEGNVRAKTGTLSNVGALSGYVATADREPLVFSVIVNGSLLPNQAVRGLLDEVAVILAEHVTR